MTKILLAFLTTSMLLVTAISVADISSPIEKIIIDDKTWVSFYGSSPGEEPILNVLESSSERTVIDVILPGFWVTDVEIEGDIYQEISIPGHSTTRDIGEPAIPVIRSLVAIPYDCDIDTIYSLDGQIRLEDYYITVFEKPSTDDLNVQSRTKPGNLYDIKPDFVAQTTEPGIWRDINIVTVEIAPISYDFSDHALTISPRMTIELYTSSHSGNPKYTDKPISSRFDKIYQNHVINYNLLGLNVQTCNNPGTKYLIISHPDFVSAIQPLADWHYQEGFETEVSSLSTSSSDDVKDEIVTRFNQGDLEYVLLVGDTSYMPIAVWDGIYSDYYYACITGDPDYYADIAVGRISVTNSTQASNQVNKILNYEQDPPLDSWLNKLTLVAHKEGAPGKYEGCCEEIRTTIIPQPPFIVDTIYGSQSSVSNVDIANAINQGRNVVNYRGHGSTTEWWSWNTLNQMWNISDVNALTNGDYTPIVFNIACENHLITNNCLGEAWMSKYPGGAVASLGATNPSLTIPNHDYDKELFRQFTLYEEYRIGWMSNAAATLIINDHGSGGILNAQMYLWLGDPATEVWTDIPSILSVDYPPTISYGQSIIPVTVKSNNDPVQDAMVCIMQPDGCYASGYTDATGLVELEVVVVNPDAATLTVSTHDHLPFVTQVQIGSSYPPLKPTVDGPVAGKPEKEYEYTAITTDPEEDQIFYEFDWGDETSTDWLGPYKSGQEINISHAWTKEGNYSVKVRAKDINDSIGHWSDSYQVQIMLPILEIGSIKSGFLKITSTIENPGIAEADDINWKISLDGGFILLGKESQDTIVTIPAGGEHNITSKKIIGFGPTQVTMRVDIPEGTKKRSQGGFMYLFYIFVNPSGS